MYIITEALLSPQLPLFRITRPVRSEEASFSTEAFSHPTKKREKIKGRMPNILKFFIRKYLVILSYISPYLNENFISMRQLRPGIG